MTGPTPWKSPSVRTAIFLVLGLTAQLVACVSDVDRAFAGHALVRVEKDFYFIGETALITLTNTGTLDLVVDEPLAWEVEDQSKNMVFGSPAGTSRQVKRIPPHRYVEVRWPLAYRGGQKVPAGMYRVFIRVKNEAHPSATIRVVDGGQKGAKSTAGTVSVAAMGFAGLLSALPGLPALGLPAVPLILSQAAGILLATACHVYANDPPDRDYRGVIAISESQVQLPAPRAALDRAAHRYIESSVRAAAVVTAIRRSTEKYQGAAEAKDSDWVRQHERAIRDYAKSLPELFSANGSAVVELTQELRRAAPSLQLSRETLESFKKRIAETGLPREELEFLKQAGLTEPEIEIARKALLAAPLEKNSDVLVAGTELVRRLEHAARAYTTIATEGL
jgi:hypothetical protein